MLSTTRRAAESDREGWRVEAAKQLWAGGQVALAVAEARAVLGDAQKVGDNAAAAARVSCLLGTWLAETRHVYTCKTG